MLMVVELKLLASYSRSLTDNLHAIQTTSSCSTSIENIVLNFVDQDHFFFFIYFFNELRLSSPYMYVQYKL